MNRRNAKRGRKKAFDWEGVKFSRFLLRISYLGTNYCGFQSNAGDEMQNNRTIEDEIMRAARISKLIHPTRPAGFSVCGRTDRGVHAVSNFITLDMREVYATDAADALSKKPNPPAKIARENCLLLCDSDSDAVTTADASGAENSPNASGTENGGKFSHSENDEKNSHTLSVSDASREIDLMMYVKMLNGVLPCDISVVDINQVDADYNARFKCVWREYKYFFPVNGRNIDLMHSAAQKFVGEKDFRNFCKIDVENHRHFTRTIISASVKSYADFSKPPQDTCEPQQRVLHKLGTHGTRDSMSEIGIFEVRGAAFLWHQVRCFMAVLLLVGDEGEDVAVIDELLDVERSPRRPLYTMAPENGLVLSNAYFPDFKPHFYPLENTIAFKVLHEKLFNMHQESLQKAAITRHMLFKMFGEDNYVTSTTKISDDNFLYFIPQKKILSQQKLCDLPKGASYEEMQRAYEEKLKQREAHDQELKISILTRKRQRGHAMSER